MGLAKVFCRRRSRLLAIMAVLSMAIYGPPLMALDNDPSPPDPYELVYYATSSTGTLSVESMLPSPSGTDLRATYTSSAGKRISVTSSQGTVTAVLPKGRITTQVLTDGNLSVTMRAAGQQITFRTTPSGDILDPVDESVFESIRDAMSSGSVSTLSEFQQFGLSEALLVQDASGNYIANPDAISAPTQGIVPEGVGGVIWKILVCVAAVAGWVASIFALIGGCATIILCALALALHAAATIGVIDGCMMGW